MDWTFLRWSARIGLALAVMACCPVSARGETLQVEALRLEVGPDWVRAAPEREQEEEAWLLERIASAAATPLQVAVPRRATALRTDPDGYYRNLMAYWRARHGASLAIGWLESAGIRWLACRRPAGAARGSVFHLSTVFDGRAYSIVLLVDDAGVEAGGGILTADSLPSSARALLAGARFGEAVPDWVQAGVIRSLPRGDALAALVEEDVERLGEAGMLTGYGLDHGESELAWFLDGYRWSTVAGRAERVPWSQRGHLRVGAPVRLGADADWHLTLTLAEDEDAVRARLLVWDLCAPDALIREVIERLRQGVRNPMERLAGKRAGICPPVTASAPARGIDGVAGDTVRATLTIPDPRGPARLASLRAAGLDWVRLVEVAVEPMAGRTGYGDALLRRARLFFTYRPE